ncbi:MAG TPA: hypothetical protein VMD59_10900 [Acidimicrobiales bacterium]|nr:hypothetical protein [Acidimicrobiales bacterium]
MKRTTYKLGTLAGAGLLGVLACGAFSVAGADVNTSTTTITASPTTQTINNQSVNPPSCPTSGGDGVGVCQLTSTETVTVDVPDNTFDPSETVDIAECAEVDGADPTAYSSCEPLTLQPFESNASGGLETGVKINKSNTVPPYEVQQLPITADESSSPAGSCTSSTPCVLWIGEQTGQWVEMTNYYYTFSQPFYFATPVVPEAPYAVILPLAALGLLGGAWVIHHQRRRAVEASLKA